MKRQKDQRIRPPHALNEALLLSNKRIDMMLDLARLERCSRCNKIHSEHRYSYRTWALCRKCSDLLTEQFQLDKFGTTRITSWLSEDLESYLDNWAVKMGLEKKNECKPKRLEYLRIMLASCNLGD
jgi:hypothetical protein